ncbi:hypothetical protein [Xanthomonas arboricola]|uniref:hypothetical protein n=1 Tax=Xanthomonas arboricola TaxID=56448 RepID=UPI0012D33809|nr:hypothetical protein [Xanthomonas arboricola]
MRASIDAAATGRTRMVQIAARRCAARSADTIRFSRRWFSGDPMHHAPHAAPCATVYGITDMPLSTTFFTRKVRRA